MYSVMRASYAVFFAASSVGWATSLISETVGRSPVNRSAAIRRAAL